MAHWKSLFDYQHLGCQDLPRDENNKVLDLAVSIKVIDKREVVGEKGRSEILPVADLVGASKPMILNKTNLATLANLFGTNEYEEFIGRPFILYAAKVKGKAGGIVDGLRIRDELPEIAPTKTLVDMNPDHPKWNAAKDSLIKGDTTIEQIKKAFSLSPENEKLILQKPKQ